MKAWLRQHRYALGVTWRRLAAQPFSSLANLLVIALSLAVPLMGSAILASVQPVTSSLAVGPQLTVFMKPSASAAAATKVQQRIRTDYADDVSAVELVKRDVALADLRAQPAWTEALAVLPANPLPDALVVSLSGQDFAVRAERLAATWRNWEGVDNVQLDSAWVQRLQAIMRFASAMLLLLSAAVAVVVLATVFNTVRMQALSQREEITVARLVGATERFVRRPFLYLGAITGAASACAAIGLNALALTPLNNALADLARSYGTEFALHLPPAPWLLAFVAATAALGAFSARWSVTRNTRF